jgi:hypothetical protein
VNAATAAGNVDVYITAQGADILAIAPTFAGMGTRSVSGYLERAAGAIQVRFTTAGTKTVVRDVSLGTLASGAIRTDVLLEAAAGGTPLTAGALTDRYTTSTPRPPAARSRPRYPTESPRGVFAITRRAPIWA